MNILTLVLISFLNLSYDMLEEIKPHRDRLYGVASWNFGRNFRITSPKYGAWAVGQYQRDIFCKLYKAGYIVAVKFYTGYDHYMPGSDEVRYALEYLNKVGCPAIFHCGDCLNSCRRAKLKYAHPLNIDEVAVDYPDMNFIIAHMGFPWVLDTAEVCYKNSNVYTDISGFVYGEFKGLEQKRFESQLVKFLEIAGSDKLLFGTDWPISDQRSYRNVLEDNLFSESLTLQYLTQNIQKAFKLNALL